MQHCPKCGKEYQDGVELCPRCEIKITPQPFLHLSEEHLDAEWVELYVFPGALYAQMALELLQRDSIPAYVQSYFAGGSAYGPTMDSGFVGSSSAVFVLEADLERAQGVIEPMLDEIPRAMGEDDDLAGELE